MFSKFLKTAVLAVGVIAAQPAAAGQMIEFDAVPPGSTANSAAPAGISFAYAALLPDYDAFGDEIPGSEKWQVDVSAAEVLAYNPNDRGFGAAPSLPNALDAVDQPVLMLFASMQALQNFAVDAITFDGLTFGGSPSAALLFLDASHAILGQMPLLPVGSGFQGLSGPFANVRAILLPSGAFYDNINVVPAPSTLYLMLAGLLGFAAPRRII